MSQQQHVWLIANYSQLKLNLLQLKKYNWQHLVNCFLGPQFTILAQASMLKSMGIALSLLADFTYADIRKLETTQPWSMELKH